MAAFGMVLSVVLVMGAEDAYRRWAKSPTQAPDRIEAPVSAAPVVMKSTVERFELTPDGELRLRGWMFAEKGDSDHRLHLRIDGKDMPPLPRGLPRPDVAEAFPAFAQARTAGFEGRYEVPDLARYGGVASLEMDSLPPAPAIVVAQQRFAPLDWATRWKAASLRRGVVPDDVFYLALATSHVGGAGGTGADGIREQFGPYESATMKVGIRVQILYLRTTLGEAGDYVFDPAFRTADHRCGKWPIAEDNLDNVMRYAIQHRMPVLFSLNGGIWADSNCDEPRWDVNDKLEQDPALCQWSQNDQVMPDDYLANRPGSYASPQLARSLSLNVYAEKPRHYKKRNLQQVARRVARFAREHPDLFIGVDLDHDVYINPFFEGEQWFDYNPGSLRQFREWLRGVGPYAREAAGTAVDLTRYARKEPLSLEAVNRIASAHWTEWSQVDPPRVFTKGSSAYRDDPWFALWEQFRRQLVAGHYDDLARWVAQAGIPPSRIYTGQGFAPPGVNVDPLALRIDSPAKNYDTGGASIAGSMPSQGRLGAILYGASALNDIPMEGSSSLFAEFRAVSGNDCAAVEFNTADLASPKRLAGFEAGYRAMRELANYGARLVSPMAWNGSGGDPSKPDFVSYTALRDTPLEDAMRMFMQQRANLPRSARLWEFGAPGHADTDRWTSPSATAAHTGAFGLTLGGDGHASMESPGELQWAPGEFDSIVVAAQSDRPGLRLAVQVRSGDSAQWQTLIEDTSFDELVGTAAGRLLPIKMGPRSVAPSGERIDRMRLIWSGAPGSVVAIDRVALFPAVRKRSLH